MSVEVLQLVHLSDMHLFVDQFGRNYSPTERAKTVRYIKRLLNLGLSPSGIKNLGDGLNTHSDSALSALWQTLSNIINNKGNSKLILIHSGDLTAYGHSGDTTNPYPSFDFWLNKKNNHKSDIDYFFDVFGNHDAWPGTLPIFRPASIKQAIDDLRTRAEFKDLIPDCRIIDLNSYRVEIYRLDTVCTAWPLNTLAVGKIQTDYLIRHKKHSEYVLSKSKDPIEELVALAKQAIQHYGNDKAVRIVVMHHPPHYFNSSPLFDLTGGRLLNRRDLIKANNQTHFQIIIAGHRHNIDPPINSILSENKQLQKPLPSNMVQLAAGSTTQEVTDPSKDRPSLSLYKLMIDDKGDNLTIDRVIYRHENDLDNTFTEEQNETIIQNLQLS
jgi:hypothetical protein